MVEVRAQNPTLTGTLPRDRPSVDRPHRVYVATTNHCNRSCPWCSTYSSPAGGTFITRAAYLDAFPPAGRFEVQLEGGEPTIHPEFWSLVELARAEPRCTKLVVVTNGVVLPRTREALQPWLERLGAPLSLKLSINHYLLAHDRGLLELAALLRGLIDELGGERELVLNVRLRPSPGRAAAPGEREGPDGWVEQAVIAAGLLDVANVFYLQSYGLARAKGWEQPFLVGSDFTLVNPDGSTHGVDLMRRSEAMKVLP